MKVFLPLTQKSRGAAKLERMKISGAQENCLLDEFKPYQRPSSATAAGNARSSASVADKLSEPSACPAGRRFAAALWL